MPVRHSFKHTDTLKDCLEAFAKEARERAILSSGPEREEFFKRARRAETAAHINEWANSPGLQSPK